MGARRIVGIGLAACLLAASVASAAEPPEKRVVVTDLKPNGVDAALARTLTDALLEALKARPGYRVMGRSEVALILEHEGQKQLMGCTDQSCEVDVGSVMKADLLCTGTIGAVGNAWLLNVALTDVHSARAVARASETALAADELVAAARRVADALIAPGEHKKEIAPTFTMGKGKLTLALLDLTASGVSKEIADNLTQVVALELKSIPNSSVISRDEIRALLMHEKERALLGCSDSGCLAELGGALGAQYMVAGTVGRIGDQYLLHLKLIATREARTANRVAEAFSGDEAQLISATRFAARRLVGLSKDGAGTLDVRPSPTDAKLLVDGAPATGSGPRELKAGKYSLRLEADGYAPWFTDAYVDVGQTTRLNATLTSLGQPWYKRWWVWTIVGAVAAGGGVTTGVLVSRHNSSAEKTYQFNPAITFPLPK